MFQKVMLRVLPSPRRGLPAMNSLYIVTNARSSIAKTCSLWKPSQRRSLLGQPPAAPRRAARRFGILPEPALRRGAHRTAEGALTRGPQAASYDAGRAVWAGHWARGASSSLRRWAHGASSSLRRWARRAQLVAARGGGSGLVSSLRRETWPARCGVGARSARCSAGRAASCGAPHAPSLRTA